MHFLPNRPYMKPRHMDRIMVCTFVLCILFIVAPLQALNVTAPQKTPAPTPARITVPVPRTTPVMSPAATVRKPTVPASRLVSAPATDQQQLKNPAPAQSSLPLYMPVTVPSLRKVSQPVKAQQQAPSVVRVTQRTVTSSPAPYPTIVRPTPLVIPRPSRTQSAVTPARTPAKNPTQTSG